MNKIKQSEEKLSQARNKQRAMSSSAKGSFVSNHTYSKPRRNISMGMNATGGANRSRQKKMQQLFGVTNNFMSPNNASAVALATSASNQGGGGEGMFGPNTFDGSNRNNLQAGNAEM